MLLKMAMNFNASSLLGFHRLAITSLTEGALRQYIQRNMYHLNEVLSGKVCDDFNVFMKNLMF